MAPRPWSSTLFPYTPLFRSDADALGLQADSTRSAGRSESAAALTTAEDLEQQVRSEEHTSELQSRLQLVCRLLLEKKKKNHAKVLQPGDTATCTLTMTVSSP